MNSSTLVVGDEESFLDYEEKVVYNLQKVLRTKDGMAHFAIMDLCGKLEDLIYYESLKQCNLSSTMNVWSKSECIRYYKDRCDLVLRNMETKSMNWKKIFEDNSHNPKLILQMLADENQRNRGIATTTIQSISNNNIRNKTKYMDTSLLNTIKSKKKSHTQVLQNYQVTNTTNSNTNIYTFHEDITYQNNNSNISDVKYDVTTTTNTTTIEENNNNIDTLLTEHSFDDFGFDFTNDDEYGALL